MNRVKNLLSTDVQQQTRERERHCLLNQIMFIFNFHDFMIHPQNVPQWVPLRTSQEKSRHLFHFISIFSHFCWKTLKRSFERNDKRDSDSRPFPKTIKIRQIFCTLFVNDRSVFSATKFRLRTIKKPSVYLHVNRKNESNRIGTIVPQHSVDFTLRFALYCGSRKI